MRNDDRPKERPTKKSGEDEPPLKRPELVPVFGYEGYREYLHGVIEANPEWRAFKKHLSEAAGCTPSFLAQVLSDTASFSFDHVYGIAQFLGLSAEEWSYLREIVLAEKCATSVARADAMKRAFEIRGRYGAGLLSSTPAVAFDARGLNETMFSLLHWDVFNVLGPKDGLPERLAERFGVTRDRIMQVLRDWEQVGLVERGENGMWRCRALRFKLASSVKKSIVAMYRMRSLARMFEGKRETPKFAAVRLRKAYVAELEAKVEELFEEAWRLAALSEDDGDYPVFLSIDIEPL